MASPLPVSHLIFRHMPITSWGAQICFRNDPGDGRGFTAMDGLECVRLLPRGGEQAATGGAGL
jgi:hypothetical protein